jgi:putative sigma-54 modulation protein
MMMVYNIDMDKINIKTTNIELSDAIRQYIEKKFEGIEKVLNADEVKGQIEVGKISNHHKSGDIFKAEINLEASGKFFRAVEETSDLYESIDKVKNEIISEVKKAKTKNQSLVRKGGQRVKSALKGFLRKSS